ncbi:histidine phosphatase family protein [Candidatus Woesearchaeota archaeon]|nr:histidine phosphatase family protein [Candidatus Woesearchaeota archaeon]
MTVKITYFVHGTTTDNEQDIATGQNQGELSERGIKESEELARLTADKKFEVVFCSDLQRAVDSAFHAFGSRFFVLLDDHLREANYGTLTGKSFKLIKSKLYHYVHTPFPQGESLTDVEKRIKEFLLFVKKKYDGKSIAIVGHQAPQLALDVLLKGKTWKQAIDQDWRKKKAWKPGWEYVLNELHTHHHEGASVKHRAVVAKKHTLVVKRHVHSKKTRSSVAKPTMKVHSVKKRSKLRGMTKPSTMGKKKVLPVKRTVKRTVPKRKTNPKSMKVSKSINKIPPKRKRKVVLPKKKRV